MTETYETEDKGCKYKRRCSEYSASEDKCLHLQNNCNTARSIEAKIGKCLEGLSQGLTAIDGQ